MKRFLALTAVATLLTSTVIYAETDANSAATGDANGDGTETVETTSTTSPVSPAKPVAKPVIADLDSVDNPEGYLLYVVQPGDNLSKIAAKHDSHWTIMAELNGIQDRPSLIWPGEVFKIPGTAGMMLPQIEDKPEEKPVDKVDVVEPITPTLPVITDGLQDGEYVAMNGDYTKDEPLDNWDYFVRLDVLKGEVAYVNWDAKSELRSTETKKVLSDNGEYGMIAKSSIGKSWSEQARIVEDAFLNAQSTDVFEVDPETNKLITIDGVDATSTVTIKVNKFVEYADAALEKAKGNLPATASIDSVSSASLTNDANVLADAVSAEGNWLVAVLGDTILDDTLVIDGTFHKKNDPEQAVYRKFTVSNHVYNEAGERDRNAEEIYTLTAKNGIVVNSPNLNIQNSIIKGDILVKEEGFVMKNVTLFGDVVFYSQELRDSAKFENTNIIGDITPAVTGALTDGVYTGTVDGEKYQDVATVTVRHGQVAKVDYNAFKIVDGVVTEDNKKEMAAAGTYVLAEGATATWEEQAATIESYVKSNPTALDVDAVSGVTISVGGALEAASLALEQAK